MLRFEPHGIYMRKLHTMWIKRTITTTVLLAVIALTLSCLPSTPTDHAGATTITVYGFSIMKEVMEKEIYPGFAAKWKREHGAEIGFVSSFAGSETVTNQILQGAPADIAILSIERDVQRLYDGKATTTDWRTYPNRGIINKTPFVILVRKGTQQLVLEDVVFAFCKGPPGFNLHLIVLQEFLG